MARSITLEWADPAALAAAGRAMTGIDFLRAMRDGDLPPPPIAVLLGFRLTEVEPWPCGFRMHAGRAALNPIGVVHGGLAMTLLDSAMGCCVQTRVPAGSGYTTLEAKTNLVRAITDKTGRLRAIGKVVHIGSRIATAEGRLEDASGKLYAHASTTCIVLNGS